MPKARARRKRLPPRWFIRVAWAVHRAITGSRAGDAGCGWSSPGSWGTMRLTTVGRKTGKTRSAILGYYEDGPNLVTMAMNGWGAPEPAWWLNLQAQPNAEVELKSGTRASVRGPPWARSASASGRGGASSAMTRTTTRIGDRARPRWSCSSRQARHRPTEQFPPGRPTVATSWSRVVPLYVVRPDGTGRLELRADGIDRPLGGIPDWR